MSDIRIQIMEGEMTEFQADVFINTTNCSLLLTNGTVSKSLVKVAGPELQKECIIKYPQGVGHGDVAVTKGYGLPCKFIYHGALPHWDAEHVGDKLDIVCLFVCNCLMLAHENGLQSLAFPALGCGFLGYPAEDVAFTMFQCVGTFCSANPATSVHHVTIVILNKGVDWRHIMLAFIRELRGNFKNLEVDMDEFIQRTEIQKRRPKTPFIARARPIVDNDQSKASDEVSKTPAPNSRPTTAHRRQNRQQLIHQNREPKSDNDNTKASDEVSKTPTPKCSSTAALRRQNRQTAIVHKQELEVVNEVPGRKGSITHLPFLAIQPIQPKLDREDTCITETRNNGCKKRLKCRHSCPGFKREKKCPPCLLKDCPGNASLRQTSGDACAICYTDVLSAAPICLLSCNHVFHMHCAKRMLTNKWPGPRITFNFIYCPICNAKMDHPELRPLLEPIINLQDEVRRKALQRADYDNLDKSEEIRTPSSKFYKNVESYALSRYCYYLCFKCNNPYFGGLAQCEEGAEGDFQAQDLVCPTCTAQSDLKECSIHGNDFQEYKCRFCCTVAVYFCFGTTHYCQKCHDIYRFPIFKKIRKCPAGPGGKKLKGKCPLGVVHPPNGNEFLLGCGLCNHFNSF